MVKPIIFGLGLLPVLALALPSGNRLEARDASCPAAVTSYVPVLTVIPQCQGNLCSAATIIGQGQTYVTSSLASSSVTGTAGAVVGGTSVSNPSAVASTALYPTFTSCAVACTVAGNVFPAGAVYYSTSVLLGPFQAAVVGGQTLAAPTAVVTSPVAVTNTYISTMLNGVPVTAANQPVSTVVVGTNGITSTIVQPASQVVPTTFPVSGSPVGPSIPIVITIIIAGQAPSTVTVTASAAIGANGSPTTVLVTPTGGANVAALESQIVSLESVLATAAPSASASLMSALGSLSKAVTSAESSAAAQASDTVAPPLDASGASETTLASATASATAAATVTAAPSSTSNGVTATGAAQVDAEACYADTDCTVSGTVCVKALNALTADVGVCVSAATAASLTSGLPADIVSDLAQITSALGTTLPTGVISVPASLTSAIGAELSSLVGGAVGAATSILGGATATTLPTLPTGTCLSNADCLVGICVTATVTNVAGAAVGACALSGTLFNPADATTLLGASVTASINAGAAASDIASIVNGATSTIGDIAGAAESALAGAGGSITSNAPVSVVTGVPGSSCTSNADCTVGICVLTGALNALGVAAGVCALPSTNAGAATPTTLLAASVSASLNAAAPTVPVVIPAGSKQCTSNADCATDILGACVAAGLANAVSVSICASASVGAGGVAASVTATGAGSVGTTVVNVVNGATGLI